MWGDKRLSRLAFAAKTVSGGLWLVSVSALLELFLPCLFHLQSHHLLLLLVWHETVFSIAPTALHLEPCASLLSTRNPFLNHIHIINKQHGGKHRRVHQGPWGIAMLTCDSTTAMDRAILMAPMAATTLLRHIVRSFCLRHHLRDMAIPCLCPRPPTTCFDDNKSPC